MRFFNVFSEFFFLLDYSMFEQLCITLSKVGCSCALWTLRLQRPSSPTNILDYEFPSPVIVNLAAPMCTYSWPENHLTGCWVQQTEYSQSSLFIASTGSFYFHSLCICYFSPYAQNKLSNSLKGFFLYLIVFTSLRAQESKAQPFSNTTTWHLSWSPI